MLINTDELKAYFADNPHHDFLTVEHFIHHIEKLYLEMLQNRDQK